MTRKLLNAIVLIMVLIIIPLSHGDARQRIVVPCDYFVLKLSREIMLQQVGVTEATGNNDGARVEAYLKSVGLKAGNPYCAAGQYYCFAEAAKKLHKRPCIVRTGLANKIYTEAIKTGNKAVYVAYIDDLLVWRKPKTSFGHIERVIEVLRKGWVRTVGFNTTSGAHGSQHDGGGVYIRKRNIYHPLGSRVIRGIVGFNALIKGGNKCQ